MAFQGYHEQIAASSGWRFTTADLRALLTLRDQVIGPILAGVRSPRMGPKPKTWTAVNRGYEQIRINMQTLFPPPRDRPPHIDSNLSMRRRPAPTWIRHRDFLPDNQASARQFVLVVGSRPRRWARQDARGVTPLGRPGRFHVTFEIVDQALVLLPQRVALDDQGLALPPHFDHYLDRAVAAVREEFGVFVTLWRHGLIKPVIKVQAWCHGLIQSAPAVTRKHHHLIVLGAKLLLVAECPATTARWRCRGHVALARIFGLRDK